MINSEDKQVQLNNLRERLGSLKEKQLSYQFVGLNDNVLTTRLNELETRLQKEEERFLAFKEVTEKIETFCNEVKLLEDFEFEPGKQEALKAQIEALNKNAKEIEEFLKLKETSTSANRMFNKLT